MPDDLHLFWYVCKCGEKGFEPEWKEGQWEEYDPYCPKCGAVCDLEEYHGEV